LYSDPDLNIDREKIKNDYNIQEFILADKDKKQPTFKEFLENNPF
jgi:dTDP-4-dehydrorhamnose 3,5-epimerase-like enzyme